jgi:hypothetical protein
MLRSRPERYFEPTIGKNEYQSAARITKLARSFRKLSFRLATLFRARPLRSLLAHDLSPRAYVTRALA